MVSLLRITLAVLVACWTPAWCCCFQVTSQLTPVAACHAPPPESTHCHDENSPQPRDHHAPSHPTACGCDSAPAATSAVAKVSAPKIAFELAAFESLPHPPIALTFESYQPHTLSSAIPPPSVSLLRLHCALIV